MVALCDANKVVCVQGRRRPIRDGLDAVLRGLRTKVVIFSAYLNIGDLSMFQIVPEF